MPAIACSVSTSIGACLRIPAFAFARLTVLAVLAFRVLALTLSGLSLTGLAFAGIDDVADNAATVATLAAALGDDCMRDRRRFIHGGKEIKFGEVTAVQPRNRQSDAS